MKPRALTKSWLRGIQEVSDLHKCPLEIWGRWLHSNANERTGSWSYMRGWGEYICTLKFGFQKKNKFFSIVNLCVSLIGSWMVRYLVTGCFWMSIRVFLDEISIWMGRVSKVVGLPNVGLIQSVEGLDEQKHGGRENLLPLTIWAYRQGSSLALPTPGSQAFRLVLESTPSALCLSGLQTIPPTFLGLQLAYSR